MAKKRKPAPPLNIETITSDTGIYRKVTRRTKEKASPDEIEFILKEFAATYEQSHDLPKRLADTEARLKQIVATPAASLPADSREDAKAGLAHIKCILHHESTGDIQNAIVEAIELGHALERLGVRPFERFAMIGRKSNAGAVKGGKKRGMNDEQKRQRKADYQSLYDFEIKNGAEHKAALARVANHFKCHERTVRNHLR